MFIKIKNVIFSILYILVIIYLLIFIPSLWGHKPLVVISGSMEPTLKVGGLLYYHEQDIEEFDTSDILVYKTKDHIISHRITDIKDNGFITKGDNNNEVDSNVINHSQILGKGTNWSIPFLGYYADFIYGHKYLLYISVAIVVIDYFNDLYSTRKKKVGTTDEKME